MKTCTAVLYQEEDIYIAECPEVGTVSQGKTVEEAVANLREATELYLAEAPPFQREAHAPDNGCTEFPPIRRENRAPGDGCTVLFPGR